MIMKNKNSIVRIVTAVILGLVAGLVIPGIVLFSIQNKISEYPFMSHLLMLLFSVLAILLISKGNLKDYGFNWNWNFPIIKIVLISLVISMGVNYIGELLPSSMNENTPWENWTFIEGVLYAWIIASIAEEVLTRGLIQGYLAPLKHIRLKLFNRHISLPVIVGALFFSLMHLGMLAMGAAISTVSVVIFTALLLGLFAGYYREKTNSLTPAILIHASYNIGGSLLVLVMDSF